MVDLNDFSSRVADKQAGRNADIRQNIQGREALLKRIFIDLATARDQNNALKISIPFRSVVVENASDTAAYLQIALGDNSLSAIADSKILKSNDSFTFDSVVSSSFLWWPAQAGKSLYLVFATTGQFFSGSQVSTVSGGLPIVDGSAITEAGLGSSGSATSVAVTTTATMILKSDTTRKIAVLNCDAPMFIGSASVTSGIGMPVGPGNFEIRNTAAVYAITAAGTSNVIGVVEN